MAYDIIQEVLQVKEEEKHMFKILAKPVDCAFVIAPDKTADFLNEKPNPKTKERIMRNAEKFRRQCVRDDRHKK